MHVLILGGNGYLGSKIIQQMANDNHTIVLTKRPTSDLSRIQKYLGGG